MKIVSLLALCGFGLTLAFAPVLEASAADAGLQSAIASTKRTPKFVARDAVRHPQQELEFFGLRADLTVVEVSPGGGYWTEILAPYLKAAGTYYVAVAPSNGPEAPAPGKDTFRAKLAADRVASWASRTTAAAMTYRRIPRPTMATSARTTPSSWLKKPVSNSSVPRRSTPIRATPRTGPRASGHCRPRWR
jgi:predicted methyltransferase